MNVTMLTWLLCLACLGYLSNGFTRQKKEANTGDVKLVDGDNTEGTVLVYRNYGWSAICDDHWTLKEANVVCRQLNMGHAIKAIAKNYFSTDGYENYLMDDVYCLGNETRIKDCEFPGWGIHDCTPNEKVGVQCESKPNVTKLPEWNKLNLNASKAELIQMRQVKFRVGLVSLNQSKLIVVTVNNNESPLCPDHFASAEGNVICGSFGLNYTKSIELVDYNMELYNHGKYFAHIGRCYGNESKVSDCLSYASVTGVPCQSDKMISIQCTDKLPDIVHELAELERTSYLQRLSLFHMECALTENCLPNRVYGIIKNNPQTYAWMTRNLMRFSSYIRNAGTADFKPVEHPDQWEWHGCHLHYHSMQMFASYDVLDAENRQVASGNKASFCLEDNYCDGLSEPVYRCSNTMDSKGTQGISPGCKDTYQHEYDCQWVDITDIVPGTYIFQLVVNPNFLVPETNFFNNGVQCTLHYSRYNAIVRSCRHMHPYDLI